MTAQQGSRSTLLTGVLLASITSGIGIFTNLATGEHGSPLSWTALVLLTAASALAPYLVDRHKELKGFGRKFSRSVVILVCLTVVYSAVSDVPHEPTGTRQDHSSTSAEGNHVAASSLPRGVINPSSLDPNSDKVATRLTSAFQQSDILPKEIRLEKGDAEWHIAPLEFFVNDDRFTALANMRDSLGVGYLIVEVYWAEETASEGDCPPVGDDIHCESKALDDGSRMINSVYWEEEFGFGSQGVALPQKNGVHVVVTQMNADREVTRKDLLLEDHHMIRLAQLGARSLA